MQEIIRLLQSDLDAPSMHWNLTMQRKEYSYFSPEYKILSGLLDLIENTATDKAKADQS